jgi:hypothetical protein
MEVNHTEREYEESLGIKGSGQFRKARILGRLVGQSIFSLRINLAVSFLLEGL